MRGQHDPPWFARLAGGFLVLAAVALGLIGYGYPPAANAAVFTQCPAIGYDTGCGLLITLNPGGSVTIVDASGPAQPPYDNIEDTLVGVVNNSGSTVPSIDLSSALPIFGFDGDGICDPPYTFAGCPFGPTHYEGPSTSFTIVNAFSGTVHFTGGLANGASAYFSLEESLTAIGPGTPTPGPGTPTPTPVITVIVPTPSVTVTPTATAFVPTVPPPSTATPTIGPVSVGGFTDFDGSVSGTAPIAADAPSSSKTPLLALGIAALAFVATAGGAGWYARRRWLR